MTTYSIAQGIQVSIDNGTTWYKLSDHNRSPIAISYEVIESSKRMANGSMRKYVIAKKQKVSTDWKDFPSLDSNIVDAGTNVKAGAWLKAFYETNVFNPVKLKITYSEQIAGTYTDSQSNTSTASTVTYYMTSFSYDITKRRTDLSGLGYDYADVKIEFTEI